MNWALLICFTVRFEDDLAIELRHVGSDTAPVPKGCRWSSAFKARDPASDHDSSAVDSIGRPTEPRTFFLFSQLVLPLTQ